MGRWRGRESLEKVGEWLSKEWLRLERGVVTAWLAAAGAWPNGYTPSFFLLVFLREV
jgi:hypothetical protein